jgi:hypothetical protein
MLLSHNFDVAPELVPALSRHEFAELFVTGFATEPNLDCQPLAHPHWMLEIRFASDQIAAAEVGERCAQLLVSLRRAQQLRHSNLPEILILGGLKTTPPTSDSPDALQPGEWGVDVVETFSGDVFLKTINWETTIASKPPETLFKIEYRES